MTEHEKMDKELRWHDFVSGVYCFIEAYYNRFIETDYELEIDMSLGEIFKELTESANIDDLSPDLKKVAEQYTEYKKR